MQSVRISDCRTQRATLLPDSFIEEVMPRANGDFVKIYIYLLSSVHHPERELSLSTIADVFSCTEKDVMRALRHWEKEGFLILETEGESLKGLSFSEPGSIPEKAITTAPEPEAAPAVAEKTVPDTLSADRIRELTDGNEEVKQLLYLAEQYLARTLSRTDIYCMLYFYDSLHMSSDLLEYLIEYCVERGKTSIHYIQKVGLEWHKAGYTTAKEAKDQSSCIRKEYFIILNAMGISNRNPVPAEKEYMDRWMNEYAFELSVILEACKRTVTKTGGASFPYAEGILSSWHKQNIHTLKEIQSEDQRYQASQKKKGSNEKDTGKGGSPNRFHNFQQRDYDYDQLEKELLKNQW